MNLNQIINKLTKSFSETDYSNLTEMERFAKIRMHKVPKEVYEFIKSKFDNLYIEIVGKYEGNLIDLMNQGRLEGWCWQTTETASLFLPDESYIERGNLRFDQNNLYYHSWIVFSYDGVEYVFDPCLQILCEKIYYNKIFEIEIKGLVSAKDVKEYFLNYIQNPPKKERNEYFDNLLKNIIGEDIYSKKQNEIVIEDKEHPSAPMYRNGVGYRTTLEEGKIKKLVAHYYYTDC